MDDLDIVRYIDTLIMSVNQSLTDYKAAQTKAVEAALAATDKALAKAEREMDRRLTVINDRLNLLEHKASNG